MDRRSELDNFKTEIDLVAYAVEALGFRVDQSSRASARLKKDGDIIIVARAADGHFTYFSPLDDADHGTIIDLLQRRRKLSLGEIRRELRAWLGRPVQPAPQPSLAAHTQGLSEADRARLQCRLRYLKPAGQHPYLLGRAIPASVLTDDRFASRLYADERGNILFPHEDAGGLCGFEIRGPSYKGFSRGEKGLWLSATRPDDHTLVITESAIDALSYHALHTPPHARYASTAGGWGPKTGKLLVQAVKSLAEPRQVLMAFDNDNQGRAYVVKCRTLFADEVIAPKMSLPGPFGMDWNGTLCR